MKKIIGFIAMIIGILAFALTANAEDTVKFTRIQNYNGITYTSLDTLTYGTIHADDVKPLPNGLSNEGFIYSFAMYYDKIYYLTGRQGTDGVIGSIYSCNPDGTENTLIANDAEINSCFLNDGCLFYNVVDAYYGKGYSGGIMRINLNTGEYGKIVTDSNSSLINVVGDRIFYMINWSDCHCMTVKGAYIGRISRNDIEAATDFIAGDRAYKAYGGAVYSYDWAWNSKWITNIPLWIGGRHTYRDLASVENVTGGYVYYMVCADMKYYIDGSYTDVYMIRVPMDGKGYEVVAEWFIS